MTPLDIRDSGSPSDTSPLDIPDFGPPLDVRSVREGPAGDGIRVRMSRITGLTHKSALRRPLYLPAVLDEFPRHEDSPTNHYDTIDAGEFALSPQGGEGDRKLRTLDLDTLTIRWDPIWLVSRRQNPEDVRDQLISLMRLKNEGVFDLLAMLHLAGHSSRVLRMRAKIVALDGPTIKHGEPDTSYYSLSVEEWRDPSLGRRAHTSTGRGKVDLPTTHELKGNETLMSLSKRYYGSYAGWTWIRDSKHNHVPKKWGQSTPLVRLKAYKHKGEKGAGTYKVWIPEKRKTAASGPGRGSLSGRGTGTGGIAPVV